MLTAGAAPERISSAVVLVTSRRNAHDHVAFFEPGPRTDAFGASMPGERL